MTAAGHVYRCSAVLYSESSFVSVPDNYGQIG